MSVRLAVLAILSEAPAHGYQLRAEFEHRTGGAWPLNIGQVYTTLQRLERDGLVSADDPAPDGHVVHRITAAGRAAAREWFSDSVDRTKPARDELAMKLALAASLNSVDVGAVIQRQRAASVRALRDLTRLKPDAESAADSADVMGWSLALDALVFQTEAEVRWLDHVEARLVTHAPKRKRHRPRHEPSPPTGSGTAESEAQPNPDRTARTASATDLVLNLDERIRS